jgi:hypothetical protein
MMKVMIAVTLLLMLLMAEFHAYQTGFSCMHRPEDWKDNVILSVVLLKWMFPRCEVDVCGAG